MWIFSVWKCLTRTKWMVCTVRSPFPFLTCRETYAQWDMEYTEAEALQLSHNRDWFYQHKTSRPPLAGFVNLKHALMKISYINKTVKYKLNSLRKKYGKEKQDKEKLRRGTVGSLRNEVHCVKLHLQPASLILAPNTSFVSIRANFVVMENLFCAQEQAKVL